MTGERTALQLYRSHRHTMVRYASGLLGDRAQAEDIVQEAWILLDRHTDRGTIRDPVAYLRRIVRNLVFDTARRRTAERRDGGEALEIAARTIVDDTPSPETALIGRDEVQAVLDAIAEMPERQQVALRMYHLEGRKLREVAAHLGVSIGLVHLLITQGLEICDRRRNNPSQRRLD